MLKHEYSYKYDTGTGGTSLEASCSCNGEVAWRSYHWNDISEEDMVARDKRTGRYKDHELITTSKRFPPTAYFQGKNGKATHTYWMYHLGYDEPPFEVSWAKWEHTRESFATGKWSPYTKYHIGVFMKHSRGWKFIGVGPSTDSAYALIAKHAAKYINGEWLKNTATGVQPANLSVKGAVERLVIDVKKAPHKKLITLVGAIDEALLQMQILEELKEHAMNRIMKELQ